MEVVRSVYYHVPCDQFGVYLFKPLYYPQSKLTYRQMGNGILPLYHIFMKWYPYFIPI
jgi:hypothetical protein